MSDPLVSRAEDKDDMVNIKQEFVAEVLGTAVLVILGCGVVATVVMEDKEVTMADRLYINLGWGAAVAFGILVSFEVSGAHLNPAVTLSNIIFGGISPKKGGIFMGAQFLGAFLGACVITLAYQSGEKSVLPEVGNYHTSGAATGINSFLAFMTEVICTAFLLLGINYAVDGNPAPNKLIVAGGVGMLVFTIGQCIGTLTGYAMNPARDFSPRVANTLFRLFHSQMDVGELWKDGYFLVPIFAPFVGAPLGTALYKMTSKPPPVITPPVTATEMGTEAVL